MARGVEGFLLDFPAALDANITRCLVCFGSSLVDFKNDKPSRGLRNNCVLLILWPSPSRPPHPQALSE